MPDAVDIQTRLDADRKALLDLSLRNPLINYRPRSRSLEFPGSSPPDLFRALVVEGQSLAFLPTAIGPVPDADSAEPDQASLKLRTTLPAGELQGRLLAIYYAARTAVEEQGVNTLFLALGRLTWFEDDDSERALHAPLVLVPVTLGRSTARERFRLRHGGEDPGLNLSLVEKLKADFGIGLPGSEEDEEFDVSSAFEAVARAVVDEQPRWSVDREAAVLGFFSFGKWLMYRDLDEAAWPADARPADHPLVRALLGDGFMDSHAHADEPENQRPDADAAGLKTVVDADGTQTLALLDVAGGRNLVIQGPPGTGKSQTITNLIADAVGRGRSVLFVAEKMAALDVVKRRLDAAGLGEACLELHSHQIGKKAVLDQLRRALGAGQPRRPRPDDSARLIESRGRLDAYCDAVNTPIGDTGVTPFHAAGEVVRLREGLAGSSPPRFELPGSEAWSPSDFRARLDLVERLQDRLAFPGGLRANPFFGSRRESWPPGEGDRLRSQVRAAGHSASALREAASALAEVLGLEVPLNRLGCEALLRSARAVREVGRWEAIDLRADWLESARETDALIAAGRDYRRLIDRYGPGLTREAWDADLDEVSRVLVSRGRSPWRLTSSEYRNALKTLAAVCRSALPPSSHERLELIDALAEVRRLKRVIEGQNDLGSRLFGRYWRVEATDWEDAASLASCARRFRLDVKEGRLPRGLLDVTPGQTSIALDSLIRALESAGRAHAEAVGGVLGTLEFDESARFGEVGGLASLGFEEQGRLFEAWDVERPAAEAVASLNRFAGRCRKEGLGEVASLAEEWDGAAEHLTDAFRLAVFDALLKRAERERPALADFEAAAQERTIIEFARADSDALARSREGLAFDHWKRLPKHEAGGQLALLRRELAKRARHLPVRQLVARAGLALRAIKPVFLMSPLSVSTFLPPGTFGFDLVVFDEASQVRPVDALGALLRARQAVVVGDGKQLPPSSFFDRLTAGDDADDEDATAEVESVLGLFVAQGAPERMLRWHYRSRHESLIAVSNREFYDGRLVVFPSPDAARAGSGLALRHLPGTAYDRGKSRTNPGEADAVAKAVMAFARTQEASPPGSRKTLGVATFSAAQRHAVMVRLDRLRRADPSCEGFFDPAAAEPFFVKNLENVQGDERDVVFISIGYGRTADGTVSMNFGPLNAEGGERRLNVLITRARLRCEVFTNLTADDIDPARSRSRGVRALRTFLAAAEGGSTAGSGPPEDAESGLRYVVSDALRRAGFASHAVAASDEGRVDLAVFDPSKPGRAVLGVTFDGPTYLNAGPARDRDRLRPQVLRNLGWRLHRAWSPDWRRDLDRARSRLLESLRAAGAEAHEATSAEVEQPSEIGPEEACTEPVGASVPAYRMASLDQDRVGPDPSVLPIEDLAGLVAEVVDVEGPVHASEIVRRVADAAGLKRTGPKLIEALGAAYRHLTLVDAVRVDGEFLWPVGMREAPVRDRSALPAASRKLDLVCDRELAAAAERAVAESFGMTPDAVPAAACRLLGFARSSEEMRVRAAAVVVSLRDENRLSVRGDVLVARPADAG